MPDFDEGERPPAFRRRRAARRIFSALMDEAPKFALFAGQHVSCSLALGRANRGSEGRCAVKIRSLNKE